MPKLFHKIGLLALLSCCSSQDTGVTTQVFCDSGEECSFDFDLSGREKVALSANFLNEENELEVVDVNNGEFSWSIETSFMSDMLYIDVENKSAYDYNVFLHWIYEEPESWWQEIEIE